MASVNEHKIIGHLGADPEIHTLNSGKKVAKFTVATTESWKDAKGEKVEATTWHNISSFKSIDYIEKWLKKGDMVYVCGTVNHDKYTDKNGVEKYFTHIKAEDIQGLSKAQHRQDSAPQQQPTTRTRPQDTRPQSPNQAKQQPQGNQQNGDSFPWEK